MQKIIRRFLNFLVFSNLFIAFAAAAQVAFTYQILNTEPNVWLIKLVFFATFTFYNFSILLAKPKNTSTSSSKRASWIFAHQGFLISASLTAMVAAILIALKLKMSTQLLLALLAILSAAYNLPLFKINKQKTGLRSVPGIKLLLIAGVWSASTVVLPILESGTLILNSSEIVVLIFHRLLFVAAITIPFDIRDRYQDKIYALKTIPVLLGTQKSELICQILLALSIILFGIFSRFTGEIFSVNLLITAFAGWLIIKAQWQKNDYYYFLCLDGLLILPWIFIQSIQYLTT